MSDNVYKKIEVTGTSTESIEQAVNGAIARASESIHNLRWFEVTEIRGSVNENKVDNWQVSMKIGFTIDS